MFAAAISPVELPSRPTYVHHRVARATSLEELASYLSRRLAVVRSFRLRRHGALSSARGDAIDRSETSVEDPDHQPISAIV